MVQHPKHPVDLDLDRELFTQSALLRGFGYGLVGYRRWAKPVAYSMFAFDLAAGRWSQCFASAEDPTKTLVYTAMTWDGETPLQAFLAECERVSSPTTVGAQRIWTFGEFARRPYFGAAVIETPTIDEELGEIARMLADEEYARAKAALDALERRVGPHEPKLTELRTELALEEMTDGAPQTTPESETDRD